MRPCFDSGAVFTVVESCLESLESMICMLNVALVVLHQQFVEDGLHSAHIIKGYRTACRLVSEPI